MSRGRSRVNRTIAVAARSGAAAAARSSVGSAGVAAEIGMAALELAKRAQAAGLVTLGYLLESVALEAGAEAAASEWPVETSER